MMCSRRVRTRLSEASATQNTGKRAFPLVVALIAELGYRRKPRHGRPGLSQSLVSNPMRVSASEPPEYVSDIILSITIEDG